jgi:SAM-dependent methyltransferase
MNHVSDYRASHLANADKYDDLFADHSYSALLWSLEKDALGTVLRSHLQHRHSSHLDIACGTGRVLQHLQPYFATSVGVDISEPMLQVARRKSLKIVRADSSLELPFHRQFSVVTAFRFFLNAEPTLRLAVARAAAKSLEPTGIFVFNNHRNYSSLTYRILRAAKKDKAVLKCMKHEEVLELISASGLTLSNYFSLGLTPATQERMFLGATVTASIDRAAQRLLSRSLLCNDVVYVCRQSRPVECQQ